jgi:hypothetical protein
VAALEIVQLRASEKAPVANRRAGFQPAPQKGRPTKSGSFHFGCYGGDEFYGVG